MKLLMITMTAICLAACDGTAWNTTVASNMAVRAQMAASVDAGRTPETEFVTRWGRPVQKVREGGQVEYIYRDILKDMDRRPVLTGDSENYVIVTFQHGIATAVRTSETEICRATFPPRPPGPAYGNPTVVAAIESCPGLYRPAVGDPALAPLEGQASATVPGALWTRDSGAGWPEATPISAERSSGNGKFPK